jgi:hypothetical protein
MTRIFTCFLAFFPGFLLAQMSRYERTNGQETATHAEIIDWYTQLDKQYDQAKLIEVGGWQDGHWQTTTPVSLISR